MKFLQYKKICTFENILLSISINLKTMPSNKLHYTPFKLDNVIQLLYIKELLQHQWMYEWIYVYLFVYCTMTFSESFLPVFCVMGVKWLGVSWFVRLLLFNSRTSVIGMCLMISRQIMSFLWPYNTKIIFKCPNLFFLNFSLIWNLFMSFYWCHSFIEFLEGVLFYKKLHSYLFIF